MAQLAKLELRELLGHLDRMVVLAGRDLLALLALLALPVLRDRRAVWVCVWVTTALIWAKPLTD